MKVAHMILAGGMLVAGTINTVASKLQDSFEVRGLPHDPPHKFSHPAVQTLTMFIGEFLCLIAFKVLGYHYRDKLSTHSEPRSEFKSAAFPLWVFAVPAVCDMTGSTLMFIGLILTYPSVYQMIRGVIVVFTGLFSWMFLGRKLFYHHIIGMCLIIAGTAVVGLSSVLHGKSGPAPNPLLGNIFVISAQVVAATQMVVEEKLIGKYNIPPLQVVGNEGTWGILLTSVVLFGLYWIPAVRKVDNSLDAILQIYNGHLLLLALLASIFSIAFFNYFGISVTKYLSATHRTTIDAARVFLVWMVSLIVKWEKFDWIQLIGFAVLLSGTALFNEIIKLPKCEDDKRKSINNMDKGKSAEERPLLDE